MNLIALLEQSPKNPQLLKLLFETYQKMDDWSLIASLLPTLKRHRVLPPEFLLRTEKKVHHYCLQQTATQGLEPLQDYWRTMPGLWKKEHDLVDKYANLLSKHHADISAESLLHDFLKKEWVPDLVYRYGLLTFDNPTKPLHTAEKWLKHHPHDATLLLTLGRLSLRCELWGKAQEYLDLSVKNNPSKDAYQLLAELAERNGNLGLALRLSQKALEF
jgi:HemY protein